MDTSTTQVYSPSNSEDVLNLYYQEAGKYKLLSRKEEIDLFKTLHKWSYNKSNCGGSVRNKAKIARDILIKSNLRLVIKIANDYKMLGLDLSDLINEGNIGLIKAVDKFKLDKGAKLSHYAGFWIKQSIMRALANTGRTIRLPAGAVQQKLKILKYINKFEEENNRKPTNKEIAKKFNLSLERVLLLQESSLNILSLNNPLKKDSFNGDDGDSEVGDQIFDPLNLDPSAATELLNNNTILNKCLDKLTYREKYIIKKRFGFNERKPQTLEVIGKKFGITRERIRQIELIAMRKLKRMVNKEMKIN